MTGRPTDSFPMEREYIGSAAAAGLLSPPGGTGVRTGVPTPGGSSQLFSPGGSVGADLQSRHGSSRGMTEMSGSASSVMSSLAQLQNRYMSQALSLPGHGAGYNQLMTHYLSQYGAGGGGTNGGGSAAIPDHLKGLFPSLQHYWNAPGIPQGSYPEGYPTPRLYGLGTSQNLYPPYLSLLQGAPDTAPPGLMGAGAEITGGPGHPLFSPPLPGTSRPRADTLQPSHELLQEGMLRGPLDPGSLPYHTAMLSPESRSSGSVGALTVSGPSSSKSDSSSSYAGQRLSMQGNSSKSTGSGKSAVKTEGPSDSCGTNGQSSGHGVARAGSMEVKAREERRQSTDKARTLDISSRRTSSLVSPGGASMKGSPEKCANTSPTAPSCKFSPPQSRKSKPSHNNGRDLTLEYKPITQAPPRSESKTPNKTSPPTNRLPTSSSGYKQDKTAGGRAVGASSGSSPNASMSASSRGKVKCTGHPNNVPGEPKQKTVPANLTSVSGGDKPLTISEGHRPKRAGQYHREGKLNGTEKETQDGYGKQLLENKLRSPQSPKAPGICSARRALINEQGKKPDGDLYDVDSVTRARVSLSHDADKSRKGVAAIEGNYLTDDDNDQIEIKSENAEKAHCAQFLLKDCNGKKTQGGVCDDRHTDKNENKLDVFPCSDCKESRQSTAAQRPSQLCVTFDPVNPATDQGAGSGCQHLKEHTLYGNNNKALYFKADKLEPPSPDVDKASTKGLDTAIVKKSPTCQPCTKSAGVAVKNEKPKGGAATVEGTVMVAAGNFSRGMQYSISRSGNETRPQTGSRKVHATTFTPEVGLLPSVTCITESRPLASVADTNNNNSNSSSVSSDSLSRSSHDSLDKSDEIDVGEEEVSPQRAFSSLAPSSSNAYKIHPGDGAKYEVQPLKVSPGSAPTSHSIDLLVNENLQNPTLPASRPTYSSKHKSYGISPKHEGGVSGVSVKAEEPLPLTTGPLRASPTLIYGNGRSSPLDPGLSNSSFTVTRPRTPSPSTGHLDAKISRNLPGHLKQEDQSPVGEGQGSGSPRSRPVRPDRPLPPNQINSNSDVVIKADPTDPSMVHLSKLRTGMGTGYPWTQPTSAIDPYSGLLHAPGPPPPPPPPPLPFPEYMPYSSLHLPMDPRVLQMYGDKQRQRWMETYMFPQALAAQYPQSSHLAHGQHLLGMGHSDLVGEGYPEVRVTGHGPPPGNPAERRNSQASSISIDVEDSGSGTLPSSREHSRERPSVTTHACPSPHGSPRKDCKPFKRSSDGKIKIESPGQDRKESVTVSGVHTKVEKVEDEVDMALRSKASKMESSTRAKTVFMDKSQGSQDEKIDVTSVESKLKAESSNVGIKDKTQSLSTRSGSKVTSKPGEGHTDRSSQGHDGPNTNTTTSSANIPVGIAYARQRTATQSDSKDILTHSIQRDTEEGQRSIGQGQGQDGIDHTSAPSGVSGSDVSSSSSGSTEEGSTVNDTESRACVESRGGGDQQRALSGYTRGGTTPMSLQPIPIPPGYKLVQDKATGQMFLLPDPNLLGVSYESEVAMETDQSRKNIFDQISRLKNDSDWVDSQDSIANKNSPVTVATVTVTKPVINGASHNVVYTSPWLPLEKVQSKESTNLTSKEGSTLDSPVKVRPGGRVQRPLGAMATVLRHQRMKQAVAVKPHTCSSQARGQQRGVSQDATPLTPTDNTPAPPGVSPETTNPPLSAAAERFVTVTAGTTISTPTQSSSEPADRALGQNPQPLLAHVPEGRPAPKAIAVASRGCSPVGFADDVPLKYLIPRKLVSTATCTEKRELSSVCVQTPEEISMPQSSKESRERSAQTKPTCWSTNFSRDNTPEESMSYFQRCTSDLLKAASSIGSPDLMPKSDTEVSILDDAHRNTPPVLTKMVDLSASNAGPATATKPSTVNQCTTAKPPPVPPVNQVQNHPPNPDNLWQAADGLHLLSIIAEQVQLTGGKAQTPRLPEEVRSVSPDINKNYNAPKSCYFETEDFAQSTARFLKKDDEEGFHPQWTSNLFKVTTEPDSMDAMELDYRVRLAEIQRKYKEKQKELAKLHPKKGDDRHYRRRNVGRPKKRTSRKSSSKSDTPSRSDKTLTSDPEDSYCEPSPKKRAKSTSKDTQGVTPNKSNQVKTKAINKNPAKTNKSSDVKVKKTPSKPSSDETLKKENISDNQPIVPVSKPSPAVNIKSEPLLSSEYYSSSDLESDSSSSSQQDTEPPGDHMWNNKSDSYESSTGLGMLAQYATSQVETMNTSAASDANSTSLKSKRKRKVGDDGGVPIKKRKPGRPKKIDEKIMTETIVAKKPKNFSFFSYGNSKGYGSAFKKSSNKASFGNKSALGTKIKSESRTSFCTADWNRRRSERIFISESRQTAKPSEPSAETVQDAKPGNSQTPKTPQMSQNKVPSLVLKSKNGKERSKSLTSQDLSLKLKKKDPVKCPSETGFVKVSDVKDAAVREDHSSPSSPIPQRPKSFSFSLSSVGDSDSDTDTSSDGDVPLSTLKERATTPEPRNCKMTKDDLHNGLSVLLFNDGLFYESSVKVIEPPDIYGVVIKGERGGKVHILPQEELLDRAILDVKPESTRYLLESTRICAYWSQQFSCLYPGKVSRDGCCSLVEANLINVEFDDGDSGKIPTEHIRMLPAGFPIQNLETNSLIGGIRKRRTTSDDLLVVEVKERVPVISDIMISYQSDDTKNRRKSQSKPGKEAPGGSREDDKKEGQVGKCQVTKTSSKPKTVSSKTEVAGKPATQPETPAKCRERSYSVPAKVIDNRRDQERSRSTSSVKSRKASKSHKTSDEEDDDFDQSDSSNDDDDDSMATSSQSGDSDSYSETEEDDEYVPGRCGNPKPQPLKNKRLPEKADIKSPAKITSIPIPLRRTSDSFVVQQVWEWVGKSTKRPGMKGKAKREYYKSIQRGSEVINVGDCAVFLSAGRTLPYVGRVVSLWQGWGGNMVVKVKWFYHPEETKGGKKLAEIRGALYQSPHVDENDVQTISHKCTLLSYLDWKMYRAQHRQACQRRGVPPDWDEDVYYLAGTYDPTIGMITFQPDVKLL